MTAIEWQERALCQQTDPDLFYLDKGATDRLAKQVCARCEVKDECLAYALETDQKFGIWGGKSEKERRALKRKAAKEASC